MKDTVNAFVDHCSIDIAGAATGPLAGRTFGAKDLLHVAGTRAGCGNPDWLRTHDVDTGTAPSVQRVLDAGARLIGKTHTDELAFSLNGENHHYGTPINVNAPDRIPGGSSSGSAAAVAAGLCDFTIGSDTGGSVRIPGSYCGIYGIRPTHDRIPAEGIMPLAPSFDTIGWFAKDPELMIDVGRVLFDEWRDPSALTSVLVPVDAWALADQAVREVLRPIVDRLRPLCGIIHEITLVPDGIDQWFMPFRIIQGWEIWNAHGDWITATRPSFGPGISDRFQWASTLTDAEKAEADILRQAVRDRLYSMLTPGQIIALPTAPGIAPLRGFPADKLEAFRYRALQLTGIGSLGQVPQITLPLGKVDGCPVGLSLMGGQGSDELLLTLAAQIAGTAEDGIAPLRI